MRYKISLVDDSVEELNGQRVVYETAKNLPHVQTERISGVQIGENEFRFNNGFIPEMIDKNKYLSEEEKKVFKKEQLEAKKRLSKELLGSDKKLIEDTNTYIWNNINFANYSSIDLGEETSRMIYDTVNTESLIKYWQILSGAYSLIGYNYNDAIDKGAPYFLQEIKDADIRENKDDITKIEAIGLINDLLKEGNTEALLYLSWSLGNKNDKMMGFTKSTTGGQIAKALFNYVDGKTRVNNKKQTVNDFLKSYAEYKADRDGFMIRVLTRIADYYNYITQSKDGSYVTEKGSKLGSTLEEIVIKLKQVSNRDILEEFTEDVMKILSNDYI